MTQTALRTATIDVRDLVVVRGRLRALDGVSCAVRPGVVGLLGPSGAGKTTLIRCLLGLQIVTSGTVTVLGHDAADPRLRRRRGYATQSASVYDDLTVRENVEYFCAMAGAARTEVARVIEAVRLERYTRTLAGLLSGGERSRLSLAVALLGSPPLLLLDEPTVGLDPVLREELWALFRRLADDGVTVVVSSHVMTEAERCDTLLLLRDGRLLAQGSAAELRAATSTASMDDAFLALVRGR